MAGNWQVGVTEADTSQMFLESGLEGSLCLTNVQHVTLVTRYHIHHIALLAMERPAHSECGTGSLYLLLRVQERARSTIGLTARVGARRRVGSSGGLTSEFGPNQSVPEVRHPFKGHKRRR